MNSKDDSYFEQKKKKRQNFTRNIGWLCLALGL